jgi:hypothetical protein
MNLFSAYDDFVNRTLHAVPGWLGKLDYVAGLRQKDGVYLHWGLTRVHGPNVVQQAATQAHQDVIAHIVRTPMRDMLKDAGDSGREKQLSVARYLDSLVQKGDDLLPARLSAGPARHFNSVLQALSALARRQEGSTTPVS